jgi:hypothetical protein
MMSLGTIRAMSAEAAEKARKAKKLPTTFFDENDVEEFFAGHKGRVFPNLGDYVPKGWKLVSHLWCDSSGVGQPDETALTRDQLRAKIAEHVRDGNEYGYGVIEAGQFQLGLGMFKKEGK